MATKPGEENVATLFGDVHYFYSPAEVKPRHHRFDKGSYVYLFENASERRCRVEIANSPGTSDQDAFEGFLDQTHVRYSYNQHCTVSISVADSVPQSQWHLPTYDPRNESKYHYKLHSLDIYFWTQQSALHFVNAIRRVLPPAQVEVLDEPAPPPQPAGVSAVVQRLENVAITDPKYKNDQASLHSTHSVSHSVSRNSVGSQGDRRASSGAPAAAATSMPPPPPPQTNFTPMAYNPAAPAAPETIRHREKTPPPDEDPLNPLAVAVAYDYQRQPFTPGPPPTAQFPPMNMGFPNQFAPPPAHPAHPVHPGVHRAATVQGVMPSPGLTSPFGAEFAAAPGYGIPPPPPPPATAPVPGPAPPPTHAHAPQPPVGGYSNYSYNHAAAAAQQPQNFAVDYSIHQQLYRPTQDEAGHKMPTHQPRAESKGKLEENVGRLERGMSGMLKKFEKKFG